jgi:hypothetical protein
MNQEINQKNAIKQLYDVLKDTDLFYNEINLLRASPTKDRLLSDVSALEERLAIIIDQLERSVEGVSYE